MAQHNGIGTQAGRATLRVLRWFLPFRIEDGRFAPVDVTEFQKTRFRSLNRILMGMVLAVGLGEAARYGGYPVLYWVLSAPAGVFAMLFGMWVTFVAHYGRT